MTGGVSTAWVTGRGGPGMMTGMDITGVYSPCTSAEHLFPLLCPSPQLRLPSGLLQLTGISSYDRQRFHRQGGMRGRQRLPSKEATWTEIALFLLLMAACMSVPKALRKSIKWAWMRGARHLLQGGGPA